jgi:hypothetical protein
MTCTDTYVWIPTRTQSKALVDVGPHVRVGHDGHIDLSCSMLEQLMQLPAVGAV